MNGDLALQVPSTFRSDEAVGTVMGTSAHIIVRGGGDPWVLFDRLRRLERLWSRFIDGSELSRVGRLDGAPALVSFETSTLIERSVEAWTRTAGLFDATILDDLEAAGYDRSLELLDLVDDDLADGADLPPAPLDPGPHQNQSIEADPASCLVRLPIGTRVDPGGIGKGLGADLVATEAMRDGATGILVSVGGDLRAIGAPPPEGWEIELDHHVVEPARLNLHDGAVATSTRLRRRWHTPNGVAHHVIDPRTRHPSTGPAVAVSVVAAEAWWAEAIATAVLVGYGTVGFDDLEEQLLADAGALVTTAERQQRVLGPLGDAFRTGDQGSMW